MDKLDIGVVGGSLGGLCAAALLAMDGHTVTIYERSRGGLDGRGAGLVPQQELYDVLRELGCANFFERGVTAFERITLTRQDEIASRQDTPQTQLSWDLLYRTMRNQVREGSYLTGRGVTAVTQDTTKATLHFDDGTTEMKELVIGADGIGSVVRHAVNQDESGPVYAGYVAWRGLIPEADLSVHASNILLDRFAFYEMPGSHILGYLVAGPNMETALGSRRYNWVWYRRVTAGEALAHELTDKAGHTSAFSLPRDAIRDEARKLLYEDAIDLLPPSFAEAVTTEMQPFVQAIFDYETKRMVNGRLLLLGDAAFVARPHTAMGVSKAAADALCLRDRLRQSAMTTALVNYERERMHLGKTTVAYGRRLGANLGGST